MIGACTRIRSIVDSKPRPRSSSSWLLFRLLETSSACAAGKVDNLAKPLRGEFVSGNYFSTFGIQAFAGRTIAPSDDQASAPPVAMLSYRAWQQQYNSDPSIVGSAFIVSGHPFTINGIAPPGFFGETLRSNPPELWMPLQQEPLVNAQNSLLEQSISGWLRVIGRLKPGASTAGVAPRLTGILRQWMVHDSGWPGEFMPMIVKSLPKQQIQIVPGGSGVAAMKADYGDSLRILLTVCCLVLLIACANIANLLLARGAARRSQTSLRLALGASGKRLIQQSFTESVVLSLLGGIAGIAIAYLGVKLIVALTFHGAHFVPIDAHAIITRAGIRLWLVAIDGSALWHCTGMVHLARQPGRGSARRQSQHPR